MDSLNSQLRDVGGAARGLVPVLAWVAWGMVGWVGWGHVYWGGGAAAGRRPTLAERGQGGAPSCGSWAFSATFGPRSPRNEGTVLMMPMRAGWVGRGECSVGVRRGGWRVGSFVVCLFVRFVVVLLLSPPPL
jgi:hypothetical protein